jgi:hypothetical protein
MKRWLTKKKSWLTGEEELANKLNKDKKKELADSSMKRWRTKKYELVERRRRAG